MSKQITNNPDNKEGKTGLIIETIILCACASVCGYIVYKGDLHNKDIMSIFSISALLALVVMASIYDGIQKPGGRKK